MTQRLKTSLVPHLTVSTAIGRSKCAHLRRWVQVYELRRGDSCEYKLGPDMASRDLAIASLRQICWKLERRHGFKFCVHVERNGSDVKVTRLL